jgi:hypothetical protein
LSYFALCEHKVNLLVKTERMADSDPTVLKMVLHPRPRRVPKPPINTSTELGDNHPPSVPVVMQKRRPNYKRIIFLCLVLLVLVTLFLFTIYWVVSYSLQSGVQYSPPPASLQDQQPVITPVSFIISVIENK